MSTAILLINYCKGYLSSSSFIFGTPWSVNSLVVGGAKRFKIRGLAPPTTRLFIDQSVVCSYR